MKPREHKQADHRIIARILQISHGESNPNIKLIIAISKLFTKYGGSWVLFFDGNPEHSKLLKKIIKKVMGIKNKKNKNTNPKKKSKDK